MTALIAISHTDGKCYVAADSRISWGADPGYPRKDNLQKLFPLAPNVLEGVCGDLEPAKATLRRARSWFSKNGVEGLISPSSRQLAALTLGAMYSAWATRRLTGRVYLVIGVIGRDGAQLYTWSSMKKRPAGPRSLWGIQPLAPGTAVVMGSVNNDAVVARVLRQQMHQIAQHSMARITDEQLDAILANKLTEFVAAGRGENVQVGGLFQIASSEDGQWFAHGYAAERVTEGRPGYVVELLHGAQGWIQVDTAGNQMRLKPLDEATLTPPFGLQYEFKY